MLSPLTAKEAVVSSQIEGTQATLEEVLAQDAGVEFDERATHEIQEVLNYRAVIRQVEGALADRPITLSLIRQMHGLLLSGVRGQHIKIT